MFDVDLEVLEGIALALHAVGQQLFYFGKYFFVGLVSALVLLSASVVLLLLFLLAACFRPLWFLFFVYLLFFLILLEILFDFLYLLLQPALFLIVNFLELLLIVV